MRMFFFVFSFGFVLSLSVSHGQADITKPNIIVLLADDLGYNDLGFDPYNQHSNGLLTPNLEHWAKQGVRLDNYYVQPICSPTRSSFMTGRYTIRLGTQSGVIRPWEAAGIALNETFVANNMQDAGYTTAMMGKWHLGFFRPEYLPINRGFDHQYGYYTGAEEYFAHTRDGGYDWHLDDNRAETKDETHYSAFLLATHAIDYLKDREQDGKPFFLYLPFQSVHGPLQVRDRWKRDYPNKSGDDQSKAAMITCMDYNMGRIFQWLNTSSLYNNTLVVFSSDNGAPRGEGGSNLPLRGWKTEIWDGGIKVAGFVHHPKLPDAVKGTISHKLYHVSDWLPTFVNLVGGNTHRNLPLDGHDIWNSIITPSEPSPRTELLHNINPEGCANGSLPTKGMPHAGIRNTDMKLLAECYDPMNGTSGDVYLFNITADPFETTNVAKEYPDIVAHLTERLAFYYKGMIPPLRSCEGCPEGKPQGKDPPVWGPWMKDEEEL